jgi:hypothetical protein
MLSGQRGDLLAGQTTNNGIRNNVGSLITDLTPYSIYNLSLSPDMSLSLGGDSISGTTTANWVWNHPYAKQGARNETVGFYTNIYNTTNVQKNYYLYYKCDDAVTSVFFNGVSLPSVASGDYTNNNPIGSKILLVALPGQNIVKVQCVNYVGRACFIAAIYDTKVLEWVSKTDSGQTNYYSATNAASTASGGYSWRSYSEPNIGNIFSDSDSQTIYEITNLPGYADSYHPSAKWIWNQPDAGQYANKSETVHFYFYINVSGTAIVNYKVYISSDGGPTVTTPNSSVSINTSNMGNSIGHANYTGAMDSQTFAVVPGRNLLQVDVATSGSAGPAGFKAYITDNNGAVVTGSETSATSEWKCTTQTQWSLANACVYVPDRGMTYNCASNIWGSNCNRGFSPEIFNGSPSASSGSGLNNYNKGNMGAQLNDRWGNNSLAYGSNATEKARQNACRGTTTCPVNYYYDATSDAAAGRCVPNGVADNAICPAGYTYGSGFDGNSCTKTTAARLVTLPNNIPNNSCPHGSCTCPTGYTVEPTMSYAHVINLCVANPLRGYTLKNPNVNCGGIKTKRIAITNNSSSTAANTHGFIKISKLILTDVYGNDVMQGAAFFMPNGNPPEPNEINESAICTCYSSGAYGTSDKKIVAEILQKIKTNNTDQISFNNSIGNDKVYNMFASGDYFPTSYIWITFTNPIELISMTYYNDASSYWWQQSVGTTFEFLTEENFVNYQTGRVLTFTGDNGYTVEYFDLRDRNSTCQPYYENCAPGSTQQSNGSCLAKSSPTNFANVQLPNI